MHTCNSICTSNCHSSTPPSTHSSIHTNNYLSIVWSLTSIYFSSKIYPWFQSIILRSSAIHPSFYPLFSPFTYLTNYQPFTLPSIYQPLTLPSIYQSFTLPSIHPVYHISFQMHNGRRQRTQVVPTSGKPLYLWLPFHSKHRGPGFLLRWRQLQVTRTAGVCIL